MSDTLRAVILGIIEGLTEFLPVSSTGHLILAMPLLGVEGDRPPWNTFLFLVQIGAILAVILHFRRSLCDDLLRPTSPRWQDHVALKLLVAFVPAAVAGLLLNNWMEAKLEKPIPVALALVAGAAAMEWIERGHRIGVTRSMQAVTLRQAAWIGIAQCVSIVPGTSRAMATILGGMLVGLSPPAAAQFSFYLAIPTLIAAGAYRLLKHHRDLNAEHAATLAVGFFVAFAVAWAVVGWFMRFVQHRRLRPFAIYRVLLGLTILFRIAAFSRERPIECSSMARSDSSLSWIRQTDAGVELTIKVVPGATRDRVVGPLGNALKIQVATPPEKGKANQALVDLLCERLSIRKRDVLIVRGVTSSRKTVRVARLPLRAIAERLGSLSK